MNKWKKILVLCGIAAILPFATLEYRFERGRCVADVCEPDWSKGPVFVLNRPVDMLPATKEIFEETHAPSNTPLWEGFQGVYIRNGIPVGLGYILVLVLPLILFGTAAVVAFRRDLTNSNLALTS